MSDKRKSSLRLVKPADVAEYLRMIADRIEGNQTISETFSMASLKGFTKLEIEIKREDAGAFQLKMKAKVPEVEAQAKPGEEGQFKPDYKEVKKRIAKGFKEIKQALYKNSLPTDVAVASFLNDAEIICSSEGEYETSYVAFKEGCAELKKAFEEKDIQVLVSTFAKIKSLKDTYPHLF